MNLKKVGMVTIGQSPRVDVVPEMKEILGPEIEILEAGALDGLTLEEVKKFSPKKGDYVLCTRMTDGSEVVIGKRFVLPRVQQCLDHLTEKGAQVLLLLCTGEFPQFSSQRLLIESQKIMDHFILALDGENKRIGVLTPLADQIGQSREKYSLLKGKVIIKAASPYVAEDEVSLAAKELKKEDLQVIMMHCIGYTQAMKKKMMEITGKPAVLARSLVARALKELLS
jgi:protein AroM